MQAREVKIGPKRAMELLSGNTHNRPLSKTYVAQLARAMERGEWKPNGETVKVARDGTLLDGQHRLQAIVNSGQTVTLLLVEGVDKDAFDTIDTGKRRTASDALAVMGIKDYSVKAAAVRLILILAEPNPTFREGFSNSQIREWVDAFGDDLEAFLPLARDAYRSQLVDKSAVVGLSYLMAQKDRRLVDTFWQRVGDGSGLVKGHPILALRKRLMDHRIGTAKLQKQTVVALIIKAWNKTRRNEMLHPSSGLSWRQDEAFPKIV